MPSFGEKLKLEREKRKMTLEEISASTKISTRMLHALEEEKFNQLPGGIFNKGFVRAYARTVGLDEDQTIADYLEATGEAPAPRPEPGFRENARDNPRDNNRENSAHSAPLRITDEPSGRLEIRAEVASRQIPWGVFAVILLIVALALSLWSHRRREQERLDTHASRSVQSKTLQPANDAALSPSQTGSAANPSFAAEKPVPSAPDVRPATQASSEQSSPPKPAESAAAPLAPGEFAVTVRAREETWLSITVDGTHIGSEVLEAGDERTLRARNGVILKAGNSGGIDLLLNGKRLSFTGESGVVKTITIGPSGIVPTAPSPQAADAPPSAP